MDVGNIPALSRKSKAPFNCPVPAPPEGNFAMPNASADVVVYTRDGCHLCDDAIALLRRHGVEPRTVDIDADPRLQKLYDHCVPVVTIDEKVRFRGRVNEVLLVRLLQQRDPRNVGEGSNK